MSLTRLSNELLLHLVGLLDDIQDINALVKTSRVFYEQLNERLYRFDIQQQGRRLSDWTPAHYIGPRISSRVLFENQDKLDADAALYIANDGNVDGNALYFAIRWNHVRTAEILLQHGSAVKFPERVALEWDDCSADGPQITWSHVSTDIERPFIDYITPLQTAVEYGRTPIARLLIDHGANFHSSVEDSGYHKGGTPLHLASWLGNVEMVKLLLERGADTEVEACGETPLFWAAGYEKRFPNVRPRDFDARWKVVKLLLDFGADPSKRAGGKMFNSVANMRSSAITDKFEWPSDESEVLMSDIMGRYGRLAQILQHIRDHQSDAISISIDRGWG